MNKMMVYKMRGNGDRVKFPGLVESEIYLAPGDIMEVYVTRNYTQADVKDIPDGATHYDPVEGLFLNSEGYFTWYGRGNFVPHTKGYPFELVKPSLIPVEDIVGD